MGTAYGAVRSLLTDDRHATATGCGRRGRSHRSKRSVGWLDGLARARGRERERESGSGSSSRAGTCSVRLARPIAGRSEAVCRGPFHGLRWARMRTHCASVKHIECSFIVSSLEEEDATRSSEPSEAGWRNHDARIRTRQTPPLGASPFLHGAGTRIEGLSMAPRGQCSNQLARCCLPPSPFLLVHPPLCCSGLLHCSRRH